MTETFRISINQILVMFIFIAIGYAMRKTKKGGEELSNVLSTVLVTVSLPAMVYNNFSENFKLEMIGANMKFIYAALVVIAVTFVISDFLSRKFAENSLQKDVYMYSFLVPNIGFMGFPLIGAIFGKQVLFNMMMFTLPYQILIYTYGMYILNPNHEFNLKKLCNPTIIAITLGIIAGIFNITLPSPVNTALSYAESCMSPLAMIMTGFVLAAVPVKPLLSDIKLYLAAIVRALIIPGLTFFIMYLLKVSPAIITVAAGTLCMPMGLNSIVFPEAYGGDGVTGAKTTFVSNVISIITIPLMFSLISSIL